MPAMNTIYHLVVTIAAFITGVILIWLGQIQTGTTIVVIATSFWFVPGSATAVSAAVTSALEAPPVVHHEVVVSPPVDGKEAT